MVYDFLKNNDLVFDVGANVGLKTDVFLKKGAKVICIEPNPKCFNKLLTKYSENFNVKLVNKALSFKKGQSDLKMCKASTLSTLSEKFISKTSILRFKEYSWDKKISVETDTLDSIIESFGIPFFCKIDVEGGELEVLNGLTLPIKNISFEFTPELYDNAEACVKYIASLGNYKFNYSEGVSMDFTYSQNIDEKTLLDFLKTITDYEKSFGDIYSFLD